MRPLYLVRHASPDVRPNEPARSWPLSERGIAEARALATTAQDWGIASLYSSSEEKARSTALVFADVLGLSVRVIDAFDELRIGDWIGNSDEFNDLVQSILDDRPLPRGVEKAADASSRFERGVRLVEQGPMPSAIVSHGRVLTSYLARYRSIESPFEYWRAMPMPGWTRIDLDEPSEGVSRFAE